MVCRPAPIAIMLKHVQILKIMSYVNYNLCIWNVFNSYYKVDLILQEKIMKTRENNENAYSALNQNQSLQK